LTFCGRSPPRPLVAFEHHSYTSPATFSLSEPDSLISTFFPVLFALGFPPSHFFSFFLIFLLSRTHLSESTPLPVVRILIDLFDFKSISPSFRGWKPTLPPHDPSLSEYYAPCFVSWFVCNSSGTPLCNTSPSLFRQAVPFSSLDQPLSPLGFTLREGIQGPIDFSCVDFDCLFFLMLPSFSTWYFLVLSIFPSS